MESTLTGPKRQSVLLSLAALLIVMWLIALENQPQEQVVGLCGSAWMQVNGHWYQNIFYYLQDPLRYVMGNPMPAHLKHMWAHYATTNNCNHYCIIMEPVVRQVLHEAGIPAQVRIVSCSPKPGARLVLHDGSRELIPHCVLHITVPGHPEPYILDGTIWQYGHDPTKICFATKSEYRTNFVQSGTGFRQVNLRDKDIAAGLVMNPYWYCINKRMDKLWRVDLDVDRLGKLPIEEVYDEVIPQARKAFRGAFQEAYP